jgi:hypothetical protein
MAATSFDEREWIDDDRDVRYTMFRDTSNTKSQEDEFIPISKILKELYEEEKERLYYCSTPGSVSERSTAYDDSYNEYYGYEEEYSDDASESSYEDESDDFEEDSLHDAVDNMVYKKFCYY